MSAQKQRIYQDNHNSSRNITLKMMLCSRVYGEPANRAIANTLYNFEGSLQHSHCEVSSCPGFKNHCSLRIKLSMSKRMKWFPHVYLQSQQVLFCFASTGPLSLPAFQLFPLILLGLFSVDPVPSLSSQHHLKHLKIS